MNANDLRTLAAMMESGQFIPEDPRSGAYARGGQGVQFSIAPTVVNPAPGLSADATAWTSLLKVNAAGGAPRLWQVVLSCPVQETGIVPNIGDLGRVKWNCGSYFGDAMVDLVSGAQCFPVVADSLELFAFNASNDPLKVTAAVAPFGSANDWRAPRRTIQVVIPNPAANTDVLVPRYAQQVAFYAANSGLITAECRDAKGVLQTVMQFGGSTPSRMVDLPGGTAVLRFTTNPGVVALNAACVFRLGL